MKEQEDRREEASHPPLTPQSTERRGGCILGNHSLSKTFISVSQKDSQQVDSFVTMKKGTGLGHRELFLESD
jgi:hypothetical protein